MGRSKKRENKNGSSGTAALRQRYRRASPESGAAQPRRSGRGALGEARAVRRSAALGAGARRRDGDEPALWGAHGERRRARGVLSEAGRRLEEKLRRLAL